MKISNRTLILLLVLILVLSAASAGAVWLLRPTGAMVEVTIDGEVFGRYPLNQDQTVVIQPEDGSWHNTLVIENGNADITESDCPNQLCVLFPPLSENELGIIYCAPHGVVVVLAE